MLRFSQLPKLERDAIDLLLHGEGVPRELAEQAGRIDSVVRDAVPSGVYVDFVLMNGTSRLEGLRSFHVADLSAATVDSKELDFILYVRDGLLACLEVYSVFGALPSYESVVDGFRGIPRIYE